MLEMSRIVGDENWAQKGQMTWNETSKKILQQASVEVTHNKRLRDKLQEIGEEGKLDFTVCYLVIKLGDKSLLSIIVLTYMLTDVRVKPDSDKIIYFTNVS